jgi:hypothetical protein
MKVDMIVGFFQASAQMPPEAYVAMLPYLWLHYEGGEGIGIVPIESWD